MVAVDGEVVSVQHVGLHAGDDTAQRAASRQDSERPKAAAHERREALDRDRLGQAGRDLLAFGDEQGDLVTALRHEAHPAPEVDAVGIAEIGDSQGSGGQAVYGAAWRV